MTARLPAPTSPPTPTARTAGDWPGVGGCGVRVRFSGGRGCGRHHMENTVTTLVLPLLILSISLFLLPDLIDSYQRARDAWEIADVVSHGELPYDQERDR